MAKNYVHAEYLIWKRIGDEIVVIKDAGLTTHVLNKTAAYIWELCDGSNGVPEIASKMCERFEVSFEEAQEDVNSTIKLLTKASVLTYS